MTLIVGTTYADAKQLAFVRGLKDWTWFSRRDDALDWVQRCWDRGLFIDPTWVYPVGGRKKR